MTREEVYKGLEQADTYFRSSFDAMYGTVACEKFREWVDAIEQAIAMLKVQEPVVRCSECKYRLDSIQCSMYSEGMNTPDNWYCAGGERRDGDT